MNHQRKHPRGKRTRTRASDWVYPKVQRGVSDRSRANAKRRAEAALQEERQWRDMSVPTAAMSTR